MPRITSKNNFLPDTDGPSNNVTSPGLNEFWGIFISAKWSSIGPLNFFLKLGYYFDFLYIRQTKKFFAIGPKAQSRIPHVPAVASTWSGYTVTTSSTYDTYYVGFRAFDFSVEEPAWVSESKYVDGVAYGTNSIDGKFGEYITLTLPSKKIITSYTIITRTYEGSRPSKWYLLGWNSDTGYETIHHPDTALTDTDWVNSSLTKTYSVNYSNKFIKFILVITCDWSLDSSRIL